MPNAIRQVSCLHIPKLISGRAATLCWEAIENAAQYELEACFDTGFGEPGATGISWTSIEFGDKAWSQLDSGVKDWQSIEALPESYTAYKGTGTPALSPDCGLMWFDIKKLNETWVAHDEKNLAWDELTVLYASGLTWNSLDARFMTLSEIEQAFLSWQALDKSNAHTTPHLSCKVNIPLNTTWALFRIRAYDASGNVSSALDTSQISVITSDYLDISPLETLESLCIEGKHVSKKYATRYKLSYNDLLIDVMPNKAVLQKESVSTDEIWRGMASILQALTKTKKAANVQLDWHKVK